MPRRAGDVPVATGGTMPEPGNHVCRCIGTEKGLSPKKKTPYVRLKWVTREGGLSFTDDVYVTSKTVPRLMLVASRVCHIPNETSISDDDSEAAKELAAYIMQNAMGCDAVVTVEAQPETYIPTSGPNMGQKVTTNRRRVPFAGYAKYEADEEPEGEPPRDTTAPRTDHLPTDDERDPVDDDTIPF